MVSALDSGSGGLGLSPLAGSLCCVLGQGTFTLIVPLSIQVYEWVPGEFTALGNPAMD